MPQKPNEGYDYLSNTLADHRLLGIVPLFNPFAALISSQRGKMMSSHFSQAQLVAGVELPRCFTGYEHQLNRYKYNITRRDTDIQIIGVVYKYTMSSGADLIRYNPRKTVIYRAVGSDEVSYLNIDRFTMRTDGYGYQNIVKDNVDNYLTPNNLIPKEMVLQCTPSQTDGIEKLFGTNLRVAYMGLPQVTEDAFCISESAAKKLQPDCYKKVAFSIGLDQIPLNLYGDEDHYRFMPDIGDYVRQQDGILCALRRPDANSIVHDLTAANLCKPQFHHDEIFRIPIGSQIVDIDVYINRKAKARMDSTQVNIMFEQAIKYREQLNDYWWNIYNIYNTQVLGKAKISDTFRTLVVAAINQLLLENKRIDGVTMPRKLYIPAKRKEAIEYIRIEITYRPPVEVRNGFKLTGRFGNKGVIAKIIPDDQMPVDEQGFRADVIIGSLTVFSRMNPGQWMEQFINRGGELIQRRMAEMVQVNNDYNSAWNLYLNYLNDCNPKYAEEMALIHQSATKRKEMVDEAIANGIYIQISPYQKDLNTSKVLELYNKYGIYKSKVTFSFEDENKVLRTVTTKKPVMIGYEYIFLLYKMPHLRACNIGCVSQFNTPTRASDKASAQSPYPQTALRLGEDEIRNVTMAGGGKIAAKLTGEYGNSSEAVHNLANHLLRDAQPGQLKEIDMNIAQINESNNIIKIAKHMFSCLGIDMSPSDQNTSNEL